MPSASGIYVGLSQSELNDLRASALAQSIKGRWTSNNGGQKSGTKEYPMSPQDVLMEVIYAERQAGYRAPRVQKVVQVLADPSNNQGPVSTHP